MARIGQKQEGGAERRDRLRYIVWNVAGLHSIEEESWEDLRNFKIIGLTETWVEKDREKLFKERLKGYRHFFSEAGRRKEERAEE